MSTEKVVFFILDGSPRNRKRTLNLTDLHLSSGPKNVQLIPRARMNVFKKHFFLLFTTIILFEVKSLKGVNGFLIDVKCGRCSGIGRLFNYFIIIPMSILRGKYNKTRKRDLSGENYARARFPTTSFFVLRLLFFPRTEIAFKKIIYVYNSPLTEEQSKFFRCTKFCRITQRPELAFFTSFISSVANFRRQNKIDRRTSFKS